MRRPGGTLLCVLRSALHVQTVGCGIRVSAPSFLRWLAPEHVIIADAHDGVCTLTPGASLDLGAWLDEYSLDRLWQIGRMGGRP